MATEKCLTEKDKIAYYAIESFIKENGYPPTIRELCRILGKSSTSSIMYRLESLEKKGYIKNNDGGRRTIRLIKRIENAKTVDAVEVVRCKNCRHYHADTLSCDFTPYGKYYERPNWYEDDFCSYGERKTENT